MTVAISSFRSDVRQLTGDTSAVSQHHTDAEIDLFVIDALRHMYAVRPESRYVDVKISDVTFPTAAAEIAVFNVTFEDRWRMGIAYHAAARAFETDVTDSVNRELANAFLQKAEMEFSR